MIIDFDLFCWLILGSATIIIGVIEWHVRPYFWGGNNGK